MFHTRGRAQRQKEGRICPPDTQRHRAEVKSILGIFYNDGDHWCFLRTSSQGKRPGFAFLEPS